jgi:hypothetical protein
MSGFRQAITLKRVNAAGTYTKGKWTESARTSSTIYGSIQPLDPKEMQLLPEGRRESESFRIYTDTKLLPASDASKKNADLLTIGAVDYEVLSCATWQNNVINHYKAIVVKV